MRCTLVAAEDGNVAQAGKCGGCIGQRESPEASSMGGYAVVYQGSLPRHGAIRRHTGPVHTIHAREKCGATWNRRPIYNLDSRHGVVGVEGNVEIRSQGARVY